MPLFISGWVEFSESSTQEERNKDYTWGIFMKMDSIIMNVDEISELLFGGSKRAILNQIEIDFIAKDRGLPINPSQLIKGEMEEFRIIDEKHGESILGLTHLYYDEISHLKSSIPADSQWGKLFKLIDFFMQIKKLEQNQIRIIAWFDW